METLVLFGQWLEKRRKALDLTRQELANQINCSVSTLRKIEASERRPSKQLAELLAHVLRIPPEEQEDFIRLARGEGSIEVAESAPALPGLDLFQPPKQSFHNLPAPLTPLIDRGEELSKLCEMLADPHCRLITLVGLGGVGKTRLAIEAAGHECAAFPAGVFFVALAPLSSPDYIPLAIANSLGFTFSSYTDPATQLLTYLQKKKMLLVLDNLEHLLDGADIILQIMESAPGVKLLLTSREQLNFRGEWVFELQGLSIPEFNDLEALEHSGAVSLFVESARRGNAGFALNENNQQHVEQICRLLGGIPLAIELAATWEQTLSCREIAQEVERSLDFLSAPMRGIPERHRSMRAVFDSSWNLLSENERHVFMKVSVFRGGFSLELARQIADANASLLSALIKKSLIRRVSDDRYDMHEVVRQYGLSQLEAAHLTAPVRDAHLQAVVQIVEHNPENITQEKWLKQLDLEQDNLRSALDWAKDLPSEDETGLHLAAGLWPYWDVRGIHTEGRQWLTEILKKATPRTEILAKALKAAGALAWAQVDYASARDLLSQSLAVFQELGCQRDIGAGLLNLGIVTYSQGDYVSAMPLFEQSLGIFRDLGHSRGISNVLNSMGVWSSDQGNYGSALLYFQESLALRREIGDKRGVAVSLGNLGITALRQGDYPSAQSWSQQSLKQYQELGDKRGTATSLNELGRVVMQMGEHEKAFSLFKESLTIFQEIGNMDGSLIFLEGMAELAFHAQKYERAARLLSCVKVARERACLPLAPVDKIAQGNLLSRLQAALGEAQFSALWAEGKTFSLEQALSYALHNE